MDYDQNTEKINNSKQIIMGFTFDIDEIFEIAEGIERNGAKFYRQAAKCPNQERRNH